MLEVAVYMRLCCSECSLHYMQISIEKLHNGLCLLLLISSLIGALFGEFLFFVNNFNMSYIKYSIKRI